MGSLVWWLADIVGEILVRVYGSQWMGKVSFNVFTTILSHICNVLFDLPQF